MTQNLQAQQQQATSENTKSRTTQLPNPIKIELSEHMAFIAKTGAGKTELVKYFLRMVEGAGIPIVIVDVNWLWLGKHKGAHKDDWETDKKAPGTVDKPHLINERMNKDWKVQLIRPDVGGEEEDERMPQLIDDMIDHGDMLLDLDETEGLCTATYVPKYLRKAWKQGRGHGISSWCCTQAPMGFPKIFKSQATRITVLKVGQQDEDLAADLVKVPLEMIQALKKYEWITYDVSEDHGVWHPPVPYTKPWYELDESQENGKR